MYNVSEQGIWDYWKGLANQITKLYRRIMNHTLWNKNDDTVDWQWQALDVAQKTTDWISPVFGIYFFKYDMVI